MSNLPVLCNVCGKSSLACICARHLASTAYPPWPRPQAHIPAQYQTPRRPNPQYSLPAQSTPLTRPPVPFHPFPSHIYHDPRLQVHPFAIPSSIPPPFQNHSALSQPVHHPPFLQATPARQVIQTPSEVRQPLSPVQESPAPANGRKRKRSDGVKAASKRTRRTQTRPQLNDENVDSSSVPGVGPSSHASQVPANRPKPITDYSPISKPRKATESKQIATDVWYFMRPLEERERPTGPIYDSQPSRAKPKSPFVGCRLCPLSESWSAWANMNGMADTIRSHLSSKHGNEWRKVVVLEKLKGWDKVSESFSDSGVATREPFTLDGFLERLARWITVDDQSLNVVEGPEFRDLLLFLNADLQDSDRTKITRVIFESYHREWKKLLGKLQGAEGRISFTSDLWSDILLRPFMAVTAHFVSKDKSGYLRICNRLIAFRHVSGQHSGARLAKHFFEILKELGIIHKVGMITLDNASNCASMMEELEFLFREHGIQFNCEENRIRCFPHVVNITVKAALKELSKSAPELTDEDDVMPTWEQNECDFEYADALESDVIGKARSLVTACRASGQRREDLQATITEGNNSKSFPDEKQLRNAELLRDMDVRWSATYLMSHDRSSAGTLPDN